MNLTIAQLLEQAMREQTAGRLREAERTYREALRENPNLVPALGNLGVILQQLGEPLAAVQCFERIAKLEPGNAQAYHFMGVALGAAGRREESLAALRKAVALNPNDAAARVALARRLRELGQLREALAECQRAMQLDPALAEAHNVAGWVYQSQGNAIEALAEYRKAVELDPSLVHAHSNLLLTSHYIEQDPREVFEAHRQWGQRFNNLPRFTDYANDRSPDRRLRIAYLSPDFREHSVARFLEPIIASHDRVRFEVFCYSDVTAPDATTKRFRAHASTWRDVAGVSNEQFPELAREDRIDILVECAGHTGHNRLPALARKPAPVQVTYLGYPDTTGLESIDYRLTDSVADPPGISDELSVEQLVRLDPCAWCYAPPANSPSPKQRPTSGAITFGSFNVLTKISDKNIAMWSEILRSVDGSKLMLKAPALRDSDARQLLIERFAKHDVTASRIIFRGPDVEHAKHLIAYHDIDIALDTYPYHGTTTTCDALWMGVPIVTLAGNVHVSRVSASLLSAIGLPELIAESPEKYVEIAAKLSQDEPRRRTITAGLRERMKSSPLLDAKRFVGQLEERYLWMWRQWCETPQKAGE